MDIRQRVAIAGVVTAGIFGLSSIGAAAVASTLTVNDEAGQVQGIDAVTTGQPASQALKTADDAAAEAARTAEAEAAASAAAAEAAVVAETAAAADAAADAAAQAAAAAAATAPAAADPAKAATGDEVCDDPAVIAPADPRYLDGGDSFGGGDRDGDGVGGRHGGGGRG